MTLIEVDPRARTLDDFVPVIGAERVRLLDQGAARLAKQIGSRTIWNINSTARGGGVAEMLHRILPLARGLGMNVRWLVIGGSAEFFTVTKRICERLYGIAGDDGALDATEREVFEDNSARRVPEIREVVRKGDLVVLHDPQTAGLVPALTRAGCTVVWRCHMGIDRQNDYSLSAWDFLRPYLGAVSATVFSLRHHAPAWLADQAPMHVIAPSLDPFAPKNRFMDDAEVRSVLHRTGLVGGDGREEGDGGTAEVVQDRPIDIDRPLVVQISRWDRLKDMSGVLSAFADHGGAGADLLLTGPEVRGVRDDPAAADVFAECVDRWRNLPPRKRRAVHLANLSMADPDDNALAVNALQRHAAVVTQKSLAEGFGLTVTEAMWKAAPVVASAIGGIRSQLTDGVEGTLVDPYDLAGFARSVRLFLDDPALARKRGDAARARVLRDFLADRHLRDWGKVLMSLDAAR
jgi:trehalose synthase